MYLYQDPGEVPRHRALLVLNVFCVGVSVGVFWEWAEWAYDHLDGASNTIRGKMDTMIDLILDAVGAFAAALTLVGVGRWRGGRRGPE